MEGITNDNEQGLASFTNEELKSFYQKVNSQLARSLLNGVKLEDQQKNIRMLNKISEELNRRKGFSDAVPNSAGFMRS